MRGHPTISDTLVTGMDFTRFSLRLCWWSARRRGCVYIRGCGPRGPCQEKRRRRSPRPYHYGSHYGIQWRADAYKFVEFTSVEDGFGRVNTTISVSPKAFVCPEAFRDYLEEVSISVSDEIQEKDGMGWINRMGWLQSPENMNDTETKVPPEDEPKDEEQGTLQVSNIILHRWRQYDIEVTAQDHINGQRAVMVFEHNTFQWDCKDNLGTKITSSQFCDNKPDCPNGRDEKPEICKVSQLPKKLSYLLYAYMLIVIVTYFSSLKVEPQYSQGQYLVMITKKIFNKNLPQRNKADFIAQYREIHLSKSKCEKFFGDLKYEMYQNPDKMEEVCSWVKEAEEELHMEASAIYDCVLTNFGGSCQLTARVVNPQGSIVAKTMSKINQMIWPKRIKWHLFNIAFMFAMLCLHMFDYVKDIGEVTIM